ncbi:signal peptidase I [Dubosiella muris]|uniref:signal peptidase I n=1 Tax=Dubosiella muris TaxID=3038133 RepID=UPI00240F8FBB|nr:signal peptidase I [Dubosiella muris]
MSKKKKNIKKRRTNFRYNENDERTIGEDILSFVSTFLVVSILIILVSAFLFKPALIQGRSMYPNFQNGDRGVSNVIGVSVEGIQRGDIVLAKTTTEKGEPTTVIKRVIGLPGETVECKEEQVYIDGKPLDESEYLDNDYAKEWKETNGYFNYNFDPVTLQEDEYFLMGDNRPISMDSRDTGPYKKSSILAKDFLVVYPFEHFGYYEK